MSSGLMASLSEPGDEDNIPGIVEEVRASPHDPVYGRHSASA